jgi:hypothetical protein
MSTTTAKACLAAGIAALFAITACESGPASGSGATIVDPNGPETAEQAATDDAGADAEPALGTRDNPLPLGTTIEMGDWTLSVTDVASDATDEVMAVNEFNDPPADGRQFVMFTVEATYDGAESGTAWLDFDWAIVGSSGNTFGESSMDDYCGVIPSPLDETGETFPGGAVSGNVCVSAASDQLDGATIRVEELLGFTDTRAFFAVE